MSGGSGRKQRQLRFLGGSLLESFSPRPFALGRASASSPRTAQGPSSKVLADARSMLWVGLWGHRHILHFGGIIGGVE